MQTSDKMLYINREHEGRGVKSAKDVYEGMKGGLLYGLSA